MPTAVLSTYFNPAGYNSHKTKYERWRAALPACELFIAEASFDSRFETDAKVKLHAGEANALWQKERLLNVLLAGLPRRYDKVVWMDDDLIPFHLDWLGDAEAMLDIFPVGQPWSKVYYLGPKGRTQREYPSYCWHRQHPENKGQSCPGGLWAARREVLRDGLIDFHVLGGGDDYQLQAWLGTYHAAYFVSHMNRDWFDAYWQQARTAYPRVRGQLGTCETEMIHLYHGTREDRRYLARYKILKDHGFSPAAHLQLDGNGLWKWTHDAPVELRTKVRDYFSSRLEDAGAEPAQPNPREHDDCPPCVERAARAAAQASLVHHDTPGPAQS